jgi:hypothetical protein
VRLRGIRRAPPRVSTSNGVDFQHLRLLHDLPTSAPEAIEVRDYAIEFRVEATRGQAAGAELRERYNVVDKLLAEDAPVLNTIRFRKGVPVASDRHPAAI